MFNKKTATDFLVFVLVVMCAAELSAQSYQFRSTWKAPDAGMFDPVGKKVAAVVISPDESLRMSAEEAIARELTARGPEGVAAYRMIPREELEDADKAQAWFERAGVHAVVVMRVVSLDKEIVHSQVMWTTTYYQQFSNYYATGWQTATPIGRARENTILAVETLLFDVAKSQLIWASVTETTNPKDVQSYISGLVDAVAAELQREGLVPPR